MCTWARDSDLHDDPEFTNMIKIEIGSILLGHTSFLFVESLCIYYFTYVETEPKAARGGTISCLDP